jgi:hypothetical protein
MKMTDDEIIDYVRIFTGKKPDGWDEYCELLSEFQIDFLSQLKKTLPTDEEIEKWSKEQSKIEPTGAEEFGRIYGAKWMRDKL